MFIHIIHADDHVAVRLEEDGYLNEVINHHAPLTPRSTQSTGLFKRASDSTGTFSRRVFREEGATENFRIILN